MSLGEAMISAKFVKKPAKSFELIKLGWEFVLGKVVERPACWENCLAVI